MRTIAHISDLHFGTEDPAIAAGLLADLETLAPSFIVISGDLTQRARTAEFDAAAEYLAQLPAPHLVVPGNHDVPLFDVVRRFAAPLARYHRWITDDMTPFHLDDEIAILGINTARSLTWKSGRISHEQIEEIERCMATVGSGRFRVLVTHHPFIPPAGASESGIDLVGRASDALPVIDKCDVDLLLAGHLHNSYTGDVRTFYPATSRSVIVAQAGTAISRRIRSEPNSYNFITLDRDHIGISVRVWQKGGVFAASRHTGYRLVEKEWVRED